MRSPITTAEAKRNFVSPYSRWHRKDTLPSELNGTLACQRLREPLFVPAISPGFKMQREDKIFAIGSCFARGVELALIGQKMDVLSRTAKFDSFPSMNGELELGFTNKYNTFSIYNELRWALDPTTEFPRQSLVDLGNGIFYDPHTNPSLQLAGLEETIHRREIMQMVTSRISQCRIVIITLGLVEVWRDNIANVFINQLIPSMHGSYPDRYELHVTSFVENLSNLEGIHRLLSQFGHQDVQIIVTVSPVPLQATFSGEDVVIANTYSKSLLRAVAQEWAAGHRNVHYFPSYEIVQNSDQRLTWEEDMRHVKGHVVQHIMSLFVRNYFSGIPVTSSRLCASPNPVPPGVGPGKTTISWFSHVPPDAAIYVSGGDMEKALFARGSHGSKEAPWIEAGATYEFSLYTDRDPNTPLARISVTRPPSGSVTSRNRDGIKSARFPSETTAK
jgi:GSCFA family protein